MSTHFRIRTHLSGISFTRWAYPLSANSCRLYRVCVVGDDGLCGHIRLCPHRGIVDTLSQPTQATTAKTRNVAEPLKSDGTSWMKHWCWGFGRKSGAAAARCKCQPSVLLAKALSGRSARKMLAIIVADFSQSE